MEFSLGFVNRVDSTQEVGKRPFDNLDSLSKGEGAFEFGSFDSHKFHDSFDFSFGDGGGFAANGTNEGGNTGSGPDCEPRLIVHNHFDQDIARKNFLFDGFLLTFLNLDFVLGGDDNFENLAND